MEYATNLMSVISRQRVGLELIVSLEAQPVRAVLLSGQKFGRQLGREVVLPE